MIKNCLIKLKQSELKVPFLNKILENLITNMDENQLYYLLSNGICIDKNNTILSFSPSYGFMCNGYNSSLSILVEKKMNTFLSLEKNAGMCSWRLPDLEKDGKEFSKCSKELNIDEKTLFRAILESLSDKNIIDLEMEDWNSLDNTDSCFNLNLNQIKQVSESKNIDSILENLINGESVETPIVLFRKDKNPYLLTGNNRLMLAKYLKYKPQILAVNL